MRSIHFVHSFSKLSETFIYDYVTSLQSQEVDVEVLTFHHLNEQERPFEPVTTVSLPWWNVGRIWNIARDILLGRDTETSAWPVYRKRLTKLFLDKKPDVLHAHFGPMGVLLAPVAKELNIPLIVTFYGYDISEIINQDYWQKAYRDLSEVADYVTVLSEEMKGRALDIGFAEDQVKVVHLGTRVDNITYRSPSYPMTKFLSIGRLAEKKGHLDTLQAFKEVLDRSDRVLQLNIIGDGDLRQELEEYIQRNNLQDHVQLLGRLPHSKVVEQLQKADAFVLNSKTAASGDKEGTPTVLVEAQAAGLPCISTFHSGIPEIIPEENHQFLAEEGNIEQIIANMMKLLEVSEEEVTEVSKLGRKRVEEAFDVAGEAAKFKQLYQELTS
ncbi:glycosyltransferase [Fodinibius sp. Rm-B-1B1-1]|uniref:glycosyltransferase n=1 Tax=Fodinibius alkaliphilus TaxID=3140241 RepID=UPI00315AB8C8